MSAFYRKMLEHHLTQAVALEARHMLTLAREHLQCALHCEFLIAGNYGRYVPDETEAELLAVERDLP